MPRKKVEFRAPPRGACPTLDISEEEWIDACDKQMRLGRVMEGIMPRAVKLACNRRARERKRMRDIPCAKCAIMDTCEKRRVHNLSGCKFAIIRTSRGELMAQCAVHFALSAGAKKAMKHRKRGAGGKFLPNKKEDGDGRIA